MPLLAHMMAQVCGLEAGTFVHTLGDAHLYMNHLDQTREQISREPLPLPTLKLDPSITNIDDFTFESLRSCWLRTSPSHLCTYLGLISMQLKMILAMDWMDALAREWITMATAFRYASFQAINDGSRKQCSLDGTNNMKPFLKCIDHLLIASTSLLLATNSMCLMMLKSSIL